MQGGRGGRGRGGPAVVGAGSRTGLGARAVAAGPIGDAGVATGGKRGEGALAVRGARGGRSRGPAPAGMGPGLREMGKVQVQGHQLDENDVPTKAKEQPEQEVEGTGSPAVRGGRGRGRGCDGRGGRGRGDGRGQPIGQSQQQAAQKLQQPQQLQQQEQTVQPQQAQQARGRGGPGPRGRGQLPPGGRGSQPTQQEQPQQPALPGPGRTPAPAQEERKFFGPGAKKVVIIPKPEPEEPTIKGPGVRALTGLAGRGRGGPGPRMGGEAVRGGLVPALQPLQQAQSVPHTQQQPPSRPSRRMSAPKLTEMQSRLCFILTHIDILRIITIIHSWIDFSLISLHGIEFEVEQRLSFLNSAAQQEIMQLIRNDFLELPS